LSGPTRQDTWEVRVSLDGQKLGVWDKKSGGEVDSDEYKYKPGGMEPHVSLGGSRTTGNVILARLYRLGRDHLIAQRLINRVGRGRVVVNQQPLDVEGNVFGNPVVYQGILKRVTVPEVDSESTDPAMIEIEVTPDGHPVV
jgi:hypothetical protein